MDRVILHCDMNNFFASVECIGRQDLQCRPVAVCGDPDKRHGIVLAKNDLAKKCGVSTGEPLWSAKAKCPSILFLPAHYRLYTQYSRQMREIYRKYTDKIESFGIDECWLDVTESRLLFGSGRKIADELRAKAKKELGLTISAGVSFNKIFAKMGSDYKKPDATTLITRENFKDLLWPLPVKDMMYVGKATAQRMARFGIHTVGQLACADRELMQKYFGKTGLQAKAFAQGMDSAPVAEDSFHVLPKSIGNSVTCPYDLTTEEQVKTVLFMLCDSVSTRLRRHGLKCSTLSLSLRKTTLEVRSRQKKLLCQTQISTDLFAASMALYRMMKEPGEALRGVGIQATSLISATDMQIPLFGPLAETAKREKLEETVDALREKFGRGIIGGGLYLTNPELTEDHPLGHRIRPGGFDDSKGYKGEWFATQ